MERNSEQIINYASLFNLYPKERFTYQGYVPNLDLYSREKMISNVGASSISKLLTLPINEQKEELDDKSTAETYIKVLFDIIQKVHGDEKLITWALLFLDGMLEENRNRIENIIYLQKSYNAARKMDCIGIMLNFLISNNDSKNNNRNTATRILAMLIEATGFEHCKDHAIDFMNWIYAFDAKRISAHAYTFAICYLVKINELAQEFVELNGINKLIEMLDNQ